MLREEAKQYFFTAAVTNVTCFLRLDFFLQLRKSGAKIWIFARLREWRHYVNKLASRSAGAAVSTRHDTTTPSKVARLIWSSQKTRKNIVEIILKWFYHPVPPPLWIATQVAPRNASPMQFWTAMSGKKKVQFAQFVKLQRLQVLFKHFQAEK